MVFLKDVYTSQLAISESAANCLALQVQHTKVGHYHLNKWVLGVLAQDSSIQSNETAEFNTTSLYPLLPMFLDKLGPNKSLEMFMSYKDMDIKFGRYHDYGADVVMEFIGRLQVRVMRGENLDLNNTEVFYDEFKMRVCVDV